MKKGLTITCFVLAICVIFLTAGLANVLAAEKPKEITVAYFLEWPTANQVAQVEKLYDKEMGLKVNWVAFPNGNEMTRAMKAGDVQIAYSQGLIPYVVAVSGEVTRRPPGTENPELPTGDVEVIARTVAIINPAKTPPFYINEDLAVDENLRLKYRYLDLRRSRLKDNLIYVTW